MKKKTTKPSPAKPKPTTPKPKPAPRYHVLFAPYNAQILDHCLMDFRDVVEPHLAQGATLVGGATLSGGFILQTIVYHE